MSVDQNVSLDVLRLNRMNKAYVLLRRCRRCCHRRRRRRILL